jgi:hypothetical protein
MKRLLCLAGLCLAALALPAVAPAKRPIESATGGGKASNLVLGSYSFGFTAKEDADGTKGQMQLTIEGGLFAGEVHARVICLAVGDNHARMLGDVTASTSLFIPPFLDRIVFQVADNGEPGDGDTFAAFPHSAADECEPPGPGTDQLEGGNIQVRDD